MTDKQWEEQREAMYYASLKNRLVKPREIKTTVYDAVGFEEFKQIMIENSPTAIYNTQWSEKDPLYTITERIWPSHEGVTIFCNAMSKEDWVPSFKSWEMLYRELLHSGMEYVKF